MTNDNESLMACAAWGSWHADVPQGMVVVAASPGGSFAEARRHFAVPAPEYAARGESKFAVDPARHAEIFGFSGAGSAKAPPALERTAAESRLADLMRTFGSGASQPARESESGQARPWGEVLHSLGIGGGTTAVAEAKSGSKKSTYPIPPKPNSLEKESTPSYSPNVSGDTVGAALPWSQVLREVEAEGAR